jgi:hypothetical protein
MRISPLMDGWMVGGGSDDGSGYPLHEINKNKRFSLLPPKNYQRKKYKREVTHNRWWEFIKRARKNKVECISKKRKAGFQG